MRVRAALAALVILSITLAPAANAQTLVVPLTGQRVRNIETATLFHTLFSDFFLEDDTTTYVQTGDIPAMWLRDSSAQTTPYIRFQIAYPVLRTRFAGVIERNARNINTDPYANAFQADYHVWERKWELDSLAWPAILASVYWRRTSDRSFFTPELHVALERVVSTYECESRHTACSKYAYPYPEPTHDEFNGNAGLIWCAFRPSDDPVTYRFNIPQNVIAVVALRDIEQLAVDGYGDAKLANDARALGARVERGILEYGIFYNEKRHRWMYAYETDGYGNDNLMDDANIPNLTTLPYLDWTSATDAIYLNTRAFALSFDDPYYFWGTYARGLGSPHTPYGYVWPLGIIGRALTSRSTAEVADAVTTLAETDSENGLIHESFYPNGYWRFTRPEFGWANALYAELLFRSLGGAESVGLANGGPILPFETVSRTPRLVPLPTQLQNEAELFGTLGRLLHGPDAALPRGLPPSGR